jgi:hypothetical protein
VCVIYVHFQVFYSINKYFVCITMVMDYDHDGKFAYNDGYDSQIDHYSKTV